MLDYANEKFGRTGMTPQGQAYYANLNEVAPLELLIQSGAAVNEGEAQRKHNQLRARPSDTPAVTAIRRRGLLTFLQGVDQWASGKIDKVDMPDLDAEIAKAGGDTTNTPPAATGAGTTAAPAAAATTAPAAAQPAPAATGAAVATPQTQAEFDALKTGESYIDPDDPTNDDGTPKIVKK
jgi:hypothetical protein